MYLIISQVYSWPAPIFIHFKLAQHIRVSLSLMNLAYFLFPKLLTFPETILQILFAIYLLQNVMDIHQARCFLSRAGHGWCLLFISLTLLVWNKDGCRYSLFVILLNILRVVLVYSLTLMFWVISPEVYHGFDFGFWDLLSWLLSHTPFLPIFCLLL
jgi:hypothetical protein